MNDSEVQIAGPDVDGEDLRWCEKCEAETEHYFARHRDDAWVVCLTCNLSSPMEIDEAEPDPLELEDDLWDPNEGFYPGWDIDDE